jgi:SIR2-like domain
MRTTQENDERFLNPLYAWLLVLAFFCKLLALLDVEMRAPYSHSLTALFNFALERRVESHLKSVLAQVDAVLFVGSGLSQWAGLPSWRGLIYELASFLQHNGIDPTLVTREANNGDLLQAASYGFDKLTRPQIGQFIRSACRLTTSRPNDIHRKLLDLGPRCFITTNYDQLIEHSVRNWRPDRYYRIVTNRQLTEAAEIVQARSLDFVFKLHGDADDEESIVLTREQYRTLLPDGDRHHALETARMLLASRPVIYLGFGLRDPDFLYIRDLLANTYKGGTRDHYAVMADVTQPEIEYWRRNYGIHFLSYKTTERPDGSRDHGELLTLLQRLSASSNPTVRIEENTAVPDTDKLVLKLMRHAARNSSFQREEVEFPLRVHAESVPWRGSLSDIDKFDGVRIEHLLDVGPQKLILIGHPGAGKTYAIRTSASRLAERFYQGGLSDSPQLNDMVMPVLTDLKLYTGNLSTLVEKTLPAGLSLRQLSSQLQLKIYLDSFNEMPHEYIENGTWEVDFSNFLEAMSSASIVIASRTKDVLGKLKLPVYFLDQLDHNFVVTEIERKGISIAERVESEVIQLLQKPFYFRLVADGTITLSSECQPRDIYGEIFAKVNSDFKTRFGVNFDLEHALSRGAYESVDTGVEALRTPKLSALLQEQIASSSVNIDPDELINWLIAKNILVPYSNARIAFFHQSVTEFLAASELARRYVETPSVLKEKLRWRRWDQALFLALSFLPKAAATTFIDETASMDFPLAVAATRYMERGSEAIVQRLLERLPEVAANCAHYQGLEEALSAVPITRKHEASLRKIVEMGDAVGAAVADRLLKLGLPNIRAELLDLLVSRRDDYNFCRDMGVTLGNTISKADLPLLVSLTDRVQTEIEDTAAEDEYIGFSSAVGEILGGMASMDIYRAFIDETKPISSQHIRLKVVHDTLWHQKSSAALGIACELLLKGDDYAVVSINFIAGHKRPWELDWSSVDARHIHRSIALLMHDEHGPWALKVLRVMCIVRNEFAKIVSEAAEHERGVLRACLIYAAAGDDYSRVFQAFGEVLSMNGDDMNTQPFAALDYLHLNWFGHETLFVSLLRLRCAPLARGILEAVYTQIEKPIGMLDIGGIHWWLQWLQDARRSNDWALSHRLSYVLTSFVNAQKRAEYITEFNKADSPYRYVIATNLLININDLTTDQLCEDAISFLLTKLPVLNLGSLLGQIATETFVLDKLLPLHLKSRGARRRNLVDALKEAGKRHGRRYIPE